MYVDNFWQNVSPETKNFKLHHKEEAENFFFPFTGDPYYISMSYIVFSFYLSNYILFICQVADGSQICVQKKRKKRKKKMLAL